MGGGKWTSKEFADYTTATKAYASVDSLTGSTFFARGISTQDVFTSRRLDSMLDPRNVMRESCDSEEHPNTVPVIIALDVSGSMGATAVEIAKQLNVIMTDLYEKVQDIQIAIMGIDDLAYDRDPIQITQFESDIRIAEQLDKLYFENGGGGNKYESYTAAWYMGARHTKLDCWKRGKKGIIITLGDETLNPYLPMEGLKRVTGDALQGDIETKDLYEEVIEKYDIYHIAVKTRTYNYLEEDVKKTFGKYLDGNHFRVANIDEVAGEIVDIVISSAKYQDAATEATVTENGNISW